MVLPVILSLITFVIMIFSILFFPKIRLFRFEIDTYWIVTLIGAVAVLAFSATKPETVGKALIADTAINPLKILVLFISMTILSIFLDELGFFRFLASITLKHARTGQMKLFLYLYITVSVLTVFTSNDIIILSFTPFICYFAKNAKIDPLPYLAAEFVAANTWSMLFIIGNPTNIYLATASGIGFLEYIKYSFLPTIFGGLISFLALFLLFRKKLNAPMQAESEKVKIGDKLSLFVGIAHLGICTVFLAIGSYIGIEMWLVSLCAVISLFIFNIIIAIFRKKKPEAFICCLKRAPYQLVPFVLSMFVIIVVLGDIGISVRFLRPSALLQE